MLESAGNIGTVEVNFCRYCAQHSLARCTYVYGRPNVLQTSTITEQTFECSAIAAKLIRWYIRTWLPDTARRGVFIFSRRASSRQREKERERERERDWPDAKFIPVFPSFRNCDWPRRVMCYYTRSGRVGRISMGITLVEYWTRYRPQVPKVIVALFDSRDVSCTAKSPCEDVSRRQRTSPPVC